MTGGYVVAIKPSARRVNAAAGEWVRDHGPTRAFDAKADARDWADDVREDGPVRVQDVAPNDPDDVDGYLVADPARRLPEVGDPEPADPVPLDAYAEGERPAADGTAMLDEF